jgi:hypothetical protein
MSWTGQLLCGRGQETGHENNEGSSPPEEIGRNGGDHGLHVGLGGRKNHSAALVFATFFRAESDQNSSQRRWCENRNVLIASNPDGASFLHRSIE